jgi:fructokinase
MELFGGIEAGGTKFVCIIAGGPDDIRAETKFPTTTPQETLGRVVDFFQKTQAEIGQNLVSIGVACFGPIDLNLTSSTYGYITTTPKPGWPQTDMVGTIRKEMNVPVLMDTDVNVAAFGEGMWGAGQGLDDFIYLTIGTGIGGGAIVNGKPVHGLVHPEMGHMRLPHNWEKDPFPGICPYHGDCLEGLACGPAIKERWGQTSGSLSPDHPGWDIEADYLALAIQNLVCIASPRRIIMGGGVMQQVHLFPRVRAKVQQYLNQYVQALEIIQQIDQFIVPPGLGNRAGALGAIALAQQILHMK